MFASLRWALPTLIIVCIALSEEIRMRRLHGHEYEDCGRQAPFMLPLPGLLSQQTWPLVSRMVLFRGLTPLLDRNGV
jgi:hypothetical protein